MNNNIIKILGLSKKAGKLATGEDPVHELASNNKARLILIASDAADNTVKRANNISNKLSVPVVVLPSTKAELGYVLGRKSCAVCALSDAGFCANITAKLALEKPEYETLANEFKEKHAKILTRKKKKPNIRKKAAKPTEVLDAPANSQSSMKTETAKKDDKPFSRENKYSKDNKRPYNSDDQRKDFKQGDKSFSRENKYSKDNKRPYNSDDKRKDFKQGDKPFSRENKYSKDKPRSYGSDDKRKDFKQGDKPFSRENKYSKDNKRPYNSDDKRKDFKQDDKPFSKENKYSKDNKRPYNSDDKRKDFKKDDKPFSRDNKSKTSVKWSDFKREQGRTRFSPK